MLKGYKLEQLLITDKTVLEKSDQQYHPIAIYTGIEKDIILGMLYEISPQELKQADLYEVSDYKRTKVTFVSKKQGWIYIKN
jgi:gamma-glutamylcyclotransferase (GGCT)/AIG2-like uncharacterized protein YtfP